MIAFGTRVLLLTSGGRKFIVKAGSGMLEVRGLGVLDGDALCRAAYGDSIRVGSEEITILRPGIKDLLGIIERRAQVMIPKDSFIIPLQLDIGCGSRIIEGGVGSGALTLVLLRAVAPNGRVFSYDNREDHASTARKNISMSEWGDCWELRVADVCKEELEKNVDAAVIDIPNPWDALENVFASLKIGGHVCCYVPNMNQLELAVKKMRSIGLSEITSFETLQREMVVHDGGVRPSFDMLGHTGYLAFGRKTKS